MKRHLDYSLSLACLGALLCMVSLLFFQKDYWLQAIVDGISFKQERRIGETLVEFAAPTIIKDTKATAPFTSLIRELLAAAHNPSYTYTLHLQHSKQVNAFALPGGYIIINTALVKQAKTPEELLGVIAHEMAHVEQRHVLKNLIHTFGWQVLALLVSGSDGLVSMLGNGTDLITYSYSRELEMEADRRAVAFLTRAGISAVGLRDFFVRLKNTEQDPAFTLLSTHPAMEERIQHLDKLLKQTSAFSIDPSRHTQFMALKAALE